MSLRPKPSFAGFVANPVSVVTSQEEQERRVTEDLAVMSSRYIRTEREGSPDRHGIWYISTIFK